jgi:hypothetical protein
MEVVYMMQITVVTLLLVEVCDYVHMVLLQDLYTTQEHIVGVGAVQDLMEALV